MSVYQFNTFLNLTYCTLQQHLVEVTDRLPEELVELLS